MKTKTCEKILSFKYYLLSYNKTTKQAMKINWKTGEENQIAWT